MAYQETYRKIDILLNESEDFSDIGSTAINVASTSIDPEHYIRRLAHDSQTVEASSIRERLIAKAHRYDLGEFSDMLAEGYFGGPRITKKAARALAEKFQRY